MDSRFHVKNVLLLSRFNQSNLLGIFWKDLYIQSFIKIHPFEQNCFMWTDRHAEGRKGGRRDRHDKAHNRFSQFRESVKNVTGLVVSHISKNI
jgi:hypothetical protein